MVPMAEVRPAPDGSRAGAQDDAPLLGKPADSQRDWAEKIQIAKDARENGSRIRKGKSVAAAPSLSPYRSE